MGKEGVVVASVSGYLGAEPGGAFEGLVRLAELELGEHEAFVGPAEDVHLPCMHPVGVPDQMTGLVDDDRLGEREEFLRLAGRYLFLPFEAGQASVEGGALDGKEAPVVPDAHADGAARRPADVALGYAVGTEDLRHEVPDYEKFPFNLLRHGKNVLQTHKYKGIFAYIRRN